MPVYEVTDASSYLPWPEAYGINNNDEVVGQSWDTSESVAWFATTLGDPHTFAGPNAWNTVLSAVNDQGDAVGYWIDYDTEAQHGLLRQNSKIVDLNPVLGASWSRATDINQDGVIVGYAVFAPTVPEPWNPPWQGFMYDPTGPGSVVRLGFLDGMSTSAARAINAAGDVVGWSADANFNERPFLYRDGTMEELTGETGTAYDINDKGHVIGAAHSWFSTPEIGGGPGVFLWIEGTVQSIHVNGRPRRLNDHDEGVGEAFGPSGKRIAWYFHPTVGLVDLNTALMQSYGLDLTHAYDINEHGHITALARVGDGATAVVLTPPKASVPISHHTAELVTQIMFGVVQDGGGLGHSGKKPDPVGPWEKLSQAQREELEARASEVLDRVIEDREARREAGVQLHSLLFGEKGTGEPQI